MTTRLFLRMTAAIGCAFMALNPLGCAPAPPPDPPPSIVDLSLLQDSWEDPRFNQAENHHHQILLPGTWDGRNETLQRLVGTAVALVPDPKSRTGHRLVPLGQLFTPEGQKAVRLGDAERSSRYHARVDGSFASALSFVKGRREIRKEWVYEFSITDGHSAKGGLEGRHLDSRKIARAFSGLPKKYRDVFLVTAATQARVSSQEFHPHKGPTGPAESIVRLGVEYFYLAGSPVTWDVIYLTVVSEGALFGQLNPKTCLFQKRPKPGKTPKGKVGALASFQALKILRETVNTDGYPGA